MDPQGRQRELVYCHECENEWFREEHGLSCPSCHSDFTEIIEQNDDPRNDELHIPPDDDDDPPESVPPPLPPHPLRDHNPWANTPDREDDGPQINRFQWRSTGPGSFQVTGTFVRSYSPRGTPGARSPQPTNDPFSMLSNNFASMMQSIAGGQMQGNRGTIGGPSVQVRSGGGPGFTYRTTSRLSPRDANQPQPPNVPVDDLHRLLSDTLFGPMTANGPGLRDPTRHFDDGDFQHGGPPLNPLFGLLMPLLNPANAAHGDGVYTQEAFDRVVTQLMEQNNMGTAPGPASGEAISELPKVKITKDMLDPKTGNADCSICMESVEVGTEVTRLWCGHWFHGDCVGAWLREHDSCPQCRKGITQARDEAQGRTGASATASETLNGGPVQPEGPGSRRRSSHMRFHSEGPHGSSNGVNSPLPAMPGAFGYPDANYEGEQRRRSSRRESRSSRGGGSEEQHSPGFADRVRGLFGRGHSDRS